MRFQLRSKDITINYILDCVNDTVWIVYDNGNVKLADSYYQGTKGLRKLDGLFGWDKLPRHKWRINSAIDKLHKFISMDGIISLASYSQGFLRSANLSAVRN